MKLKDGMRMKPNGSIEYRFVIDGKRYSVCAKTVKDVLKKEQDKRVQVAQGYVRSSDITLGRYFEEFKIRRRASLKPSSLKRYNAVYRSRLSQLNDIKLRDIDRRMVANLHAQIVSEKSLTLANSVVDILEIILEEAVKDEIIQKNPAHGIKRRAESMATKTIHRALTRDEQTKLMNELEKEWCGTFCKLLLCTGMRSGELSALTWDDVDFAKGIIHVNKTVSAAETGGYMVGPPKSKASTRDIPINQDIRKLLFELRERNSSFPARISRRVYLTERGFEAKSMTGMLRVIAKCAERAGIEKVTLHCFRDTFATRYIENGGNMQNLKAILGHSSITMTMDLYAHVLPDAKAEEMHRIKII